jgi:hypothetical protein
MRLVRLESFDNKNSLSYAIGVTYGNTVRHTTGVRWSNNKDLTIQEKMGMMMCDDANSSNEKSSLKSLKDGYGIKLRKWDVL